MKTGSQVFLACASGAFVGALSALQLGRELWCGAIGLVVGSFVGYLSYEFNEVIEVAENARQHLDNARAEGALKRALAPLGMISIAVSVAFPATILVTRFDEDHLRGFAACIYSLTAAVILFGSVIAVTKGHNSGKAQSMSNR